VTHRPARRVAPWFAKPGPRLLFVAQLQAAGLTDARLAQLPRREGAGFAVQFTARPPSCAPRHVTVVFRSSDTPTVLVDGPTESPHRYAAGSLCMWYPYDPPERRWMRRDGAAALAGHIVKHLVLEDWWRQTGEWAGEQVRHKHDSPEVA
jgi:hypothetical protein